MVDLQQAYHRTNINTLCTKSKRTQLPGQISIILEYTCRNTFINTVYGGQQSEFWPEGNGTRQGGITYGILFNFYINEVLGTIMNLPVGSSLNCSKIKVLCYADDILFLALTAQTLQVRLDSLSDAIPTLSLKINVQNSWHFVFRHKK